MPSEDAGARADVGGHEGKCFAPRLADAQGLGRRDADSTQRAEYRNQNCHGEKPGVGSHAASAVIGDRVDHSFAPCFALPRRDLIALLVCSVAAWSMLRSSRRATP